MIAFERDGGYQQSARSFRQSGFEQCPVENSTGIGETRKKMAFGFRIGFENVQRFGG